MPGWLVVRDIDDVVGIIIFIKFIMYFILIIEKIEFCNFRILILSTEITDKRQYGFSGI